MPLLRRLARAGVLALAMITALSFALPAAARAQNVAPDTAKHLLPPPKPPVRRPSPWKASALANASVFFGNSQQQVLGADGKLAHLDSNLAVAAELQALYGEAAVDSGRNVVTKRLWLGTVTANVHPLDRVSSFLTTTYESNLEKRIASRYSIGAGAKWNIRHTKDTDASLSLSLSAERTKAMDSTAVLQPDERIARFSWLGKYHHTFDDHLDITHATSYQPSASGRAQFLISTNTELRYKMNGTASLSLAFTDNYDSGALLRGARTYNDGQMLFGIAAGW